MKPTTYINWDGLKDIPFFYCDTKEDEENKDFDIYYQGKLVLHDYNHCGHYLYTAALLFSKIRNITADWVNLHNLWILRDCVRENYNLPPNLSILSAFSNISSILHIISCLAIAFGEWSFFAPTPCAI